jgi:hypothetical protein
VAKVSTNAPVQTEAAAKPRRNAFGWAMYVLRLIVVNFLVFALLAELACIILVHRKNWPSSRPSYHLTYNLFWDDVNPDFGVWHRANSVFVHKGGCYDVEYFTNSYGARDKQRSLHSSQPRTLVLGDSMVEGLGITAADRLSDILEQRTGRGHLNFGTGGNFGPLQYALLYKSMAAKFDHDLVIVGVLPDNDFHDMSPEMYVKWGEGNRYRPYYASDFSVYYTGHFNPKGSEGTWDHTEAILRAYLASYHVGQYLYTRMYWRSLPPYSGYNDYNDVDYARLQHSLLDIKHTADAHHARAAVFLIPRVTDFARWENLHQNRLGPELTQWGASVGIPVKDLLPEMDQHAYATYRQYFLSCDGHWSRNGNVEAADILQPWLYGSNSPVNSKTK